MGEQQTTGKRRLAEGVRQDHTREELDTLIYRISHDLRNPVASILGLINVASYHIKDAVSASYFNMINECAMRLDNILRELAQVTQINEGKLIPVPISLHSFVKEVCESLSFLPGYSSVAININIPPSMEIHSDKRLLTSILQNLVQNAIQYRRGQGAVNIDAAPFKNHFVITVNDNGMGISPHLQSRIFDMFLKATPISTGTGLGLYVVKKAVEKLKGSITLKSSEKPGTTFTLKLPHLPVKKTKK